MCRGKRWPEMPDNGWVSVMPHAMIARAALRPTRIRGRRARRSAASCLGRLGFLAMRGAPLAVQIIVATVLLVTVWAVVNWIVQVARKPTEVFVAVSGSLAKVPAQTWRQYGPLFDEHSTAVITPELLAALAQVESSGNPVARTYWQWRFSWNPFELYGPASSAVGMFQITDGTFAEARRYCVRDHVVVEDGAWHDPHACWFNVFYTRVLPAHAVEMTSALLDRTVARILVRNHIPTASLQQRQNLAAIIHLCGDGARIRLRRRLRLGLAREVGDVLDRLVERRLGAWVGGLLGLRGACLLRALRRLCLAEELGERALTHRRALARHRAPPWRDHGTPERPARTGRT